MTEKNNHKKIIFASNASWYLWNFRRNLMYALQKDGYEIIVLSSRDEYSERLAQEFSWVQVRLMSRGGMNPFQDFLLALEYGWLYWKLKPDLVFNFTVKPNIYSSFACRLLGIPVISTITGLGYAFAREGIMKKLVIGLYGLALKNNQWVVFQNNENRQLFLDEKMVAPNQAILIQGSGVDTEKFSPKLFPVEPSDFFTFVMIARLLRDKGIYEFVAAAQIVHKKYPKAKFVVVGGLDVENPSSISQEVLNRWMQEGVVDFVGNADDVRNYLRKSNVAVLPSYHEGLSKSLLEAMAMERPIIASNISGCRSLIDPGINGWLVPVKDSEALAQVMETCIIMDKEQLVSMGIMGRKKVLETFDQKIIIAAYKKLIP